MGRQMTEDDLTPQEWFNNCERNRTRRFLRNAPDDEVEQLLNEPDLRAKIQRALKKSAQALVGQRRDRIFRENLFPLIREKGIALARLLDLMESDRRYRRVWDISRAARRRDVYNRVDALRSDASLSERDREMIDKTFARRWTKK